MFDLLETPALEVVGEPGGNLDMVRVNAAARKRCPAQAWDGGLQALFSAEDIARLRETVLGGGSGGVAALRGMRLSAGGEGDAPLEVLDVIPLETGSAVVRLRDGGQSPPSWEMAPFPLILAGADGRIVAANHRAQVLCGAGVQALTGRPLNEWVEGLAGDPSGLGETVEGCWLRRADGTRVAVEVTVGRPESDADMVFVGLCDASRYREAQELWHESSRSLSDHQLAYWVRDVKHNSVRWSEGACRVIGLPAAGEEMQREQFVRLLHPEDRPWVEQEVARAIADPAISSYRIEYRTLPADGRTRCVRASARICRDERGDAERVIGIVHDITGEREAALTLLREQQLTDSIFEASAALLVVIDRDGRVVRFNRAAERLSGYVAGELEGQRIQELLVPPEEREAVDCVLERLSAGEDMIQSTVHWRGRSGVLYTLAWSDTAIRDENGELEHVVCTGIDLTALEEAASRATAAEQAHARDLEVLGSVSTVGIFKFSPGGTPTYINRYLSELLGVSAEEAVEHGCLARVHPDDRSRFRERRDRALRERGTFRDEVRFVRADGRLLWILLQFAPEFTDDGVLTGYLGTATDITGLKTLAARLAEAEASARRLVESSFDMILTVRDSVIEEVNPAGAAMVGARSPELLSGRPVSELFVEEDVPFAAPPTDALPGPLIERRLRAADGREVEVEGSVVRIEREGQARVLAVFRDISRRKEAERVLRIRERHFQTLACNAPVGIFEADPQGRFTYVNARVLEIAGVAVGTALGEGWQALLHAEDRATVLEQTTAACAEGAPFWLECRLCRPDGAVAWVLVQGAPQRDDAGAISGYIGTVSDISRRKRAERELEAYRGRLEERVAERTAELEAVNGELEAFSYSNRIRANSLNMAQLVEDLLEFSRANSRDLQRESVDLAELARAELAELRTGAPAREVALQVVPCAPAWADPALMRVLLHNLLENAWKYSGTRPVAKVEFGVRAEGERAVYYVRDNGVGFDPALAQHLFRPFHRLHGAGEFEGSGIGLATVQRIVNRHGGRVWAEAREGEGATFFFTVA